MTRRLLFATLAGCVVDPERLLWRPGSKLISIPRCSPNVYLFLQEELRVNYFDPAVANWERQWTEHLFSSLRNIRIG